MLSEIKTVICDFDGVFYSYDDPAFLGKSFYDMCDNANALAVMKHLPDIPYEKALRISEKSYNEFSDSVSAFIPMLKEMEIDVDKFRNGVFTDYHKILMAELKENHPKFLEKDFNQVAAYERLVGAVDFGILTHACKREWVEPYLQSKGLKKFFNDKDIIDLSDSNFIGKGKSIKPLEKIMSAMNADPATTLFIEDNLVNIKIAKLEWPEIITAEISTKKDAVKSNFSDILAPDKMVVYNQIVEDKFYAALYGHHYT